METVRFIPAGAGNSRYQEIIEVFMTVYPRWRGELRRSTKCAMAVGGLSPLARGTL